MCEGRNSKGPTKAAGLVGSQPLAAENFIITPGAKMQAANAPAFVNGRTVQDERRQRYDAKLRRELGDVVRLLENPDVEDIVLNPDSRLWVRSIGQSFEPAGQMCAAQAASAIHTIAAWKGTT